LIENQPDFPLGAGNLLMNTYEGINQKFRIPIYNRFIANWR